MLKSITWTSWQPGAVPSSLPKLLLPVGMSCFGQHWTWTKDDCISALTAWHLPDSSRNTYLIRTFIQQAWTFFTYGQRIKQVGAQGGADVFQLQVLPSKTPHTCHGACWDPSRGTGCPSVFLWWADPVFLEGEAGVVYTHSQHPTVQKKLPLWINTARQHAERKLISKATLKEPQHLMGIAAINHWVKT